jgi:REP element-mobilizing transposase RayT
MIGNKIFCSLQKITFLKITMKNHPNRKPNRLKDYDYSQDGYYFVTLCTKNRENFFGKIKNGKMILNKYGDIAKKCWLEIPEHFSHVILDEFIIMPNHVHGILIIKNKTVGNKNFCSQEIPWQTKLSKSLSSIIRGFKIGVTKYFCEKNNHDFQWQKSFYDHIIRNEESLFKIREYIQNNPLKWELGKDRNHLLI